jgi:hypothetical protein
MCAHVYVSLLCAATLFFLSHVGWDGRREEELGSGPIYRGALCVLKRSRLRSIPQLAQPLRPCLCVCPCLIPLPLHRLFLLWAPRSLLVPRNACVCVSLNRMELLLSFAQGSWACVLACAARGLRAELHFIGGGEMGRACMALALNTRLPWNMHGCWLFLHFGSSSQQHRRKR